MSRPLPNYLFHIPKMGRVVDIHWIEKKMKTHNAPEIVHVIDNNTGKRLGAIPPSIALLKYR